MPVAPVASPILPSSKSSQDDDEKSTGRVKTLTENIDEKSTNKTGKSKAKNTRKRKTNNRRTKRKRNNNKKKD